jgi:outer membrane protein
VIPQRAWVWAAAFALAPWCASAQAPTASGDTISLDAAIALALEHRPAIRAAEASARGAAAAVTAARSAYFPNLSATAGVTRTDGWFVFNPAFAPRKQAYDNYTAGLQAQQLIYDFSRTGGRVSASAATASAAAYDAGATRADVVLAVRLAYFALAEARRGRVVAEETVAQARQHLEQAQAYVAVGRRPQLDVTKTEVDLANANVGLIRARNAERTARLQFENAVGTTVARPISDAFVPPHALPAFDTLRTEAFARRPELLAAHARIDALAALVTATRAQYYPSLSANAAYTWNGFDFPLRDRWNAGLTFSLPLFQGFGVDAQVTEAQENLDAARSAEEELRRAVAFEAEQQYLAMQEAEERIAASEQLQREAEENLRLAERQYAAGAGTALDITDAQLSLANARITRIQAQYDYASADARLRRAIGGDAGPP